MENASNQHQSIETLKESDLDQVSGGNIAENCVDDLNIYEPHVHHNGIANIFDEDLNSWEDKIKYNAVMKTMKKYDNSGLSIDEQAKKLARYWNKAHNSSDMSESLAKLILGITNEVDRAKIISCGSVKDMMPGLEALCGN